MRIDELPHHSSLSYKLNFVSRRQFFIIIGKYLSKCKKCEMTHFCTTKSLKGWLFFLIIDDFFEDLHFVYNMHKFLGPVLQKVHFAPQVRHIRDGFNVMCDFPF